MKNKSNRAYSGLSFQSVNHEEVFTGKIYISKLTPLQIISAKTSKQNLNIFAVLLAKVINKWIKKADIPDKLKAPDLTPHFKKEQT